jgi:hypothetical protein
MPGHDSATTRVAALVHHHRAMCSADVVESHRDVPGSAIASCPPSCAVAIPISRTATLTLIDTRTGGTLECKPNVLRGFAAIGGIPVRDQRSDARIGVSWQCSRRPAGLRGGRRRALRHRDPQLAGGTDQRPGRPLPGRPLRRLSGPPNLRHPPSPSRSVPPPAVPTPGRSLACRFLGARRRAERRGRTPGYAAFASSRVDGDLHDDGASPVDILSPSGDGGSIVRAGAVRRCLRPRLSRGRPR